MHRIAHFFALAGTLALLACSDALTEPEGLAELQQPRGAPVTVTLAFVSTRDGAEHIYVANADGSGVTRLTPGSSPAWSWDGRKIAFVRRPGGVGPAGIYVMNFDGSDLGYVRAARTVGPGLAPAWSHDGRILFTALTGWFTGDLYVMSADGSAVTQLFSPGSFSDWCPTWPCSTKNALLPLVGAAAWSPDGRSIAFRENASNDVLILVADGSNIRDLTDLRGEGSVPAWSPDGSTVAIITDPGLWQVCDGWLGCTPGAGMGKNSAIHTYDLASGERTVIEPPYSTAFRAANPDWSPDGAHLVFDLFDPSASYDNGRYSPKRRIFTMSVETGELRQLIPEAANPAFPDYSDYGAAWSRVQR